MTQEQETAEQILARIRARNPDYKPNTNSKANNAKHETKSDNVRLELPIIDIARDPIPPRDWAVRDRIPARNVSLLSGEGAIGKSILLLQLAASTVLARDWIGMPEPGPVMYLSCEDDEAEVRRRLEAIADTTSPRALR